MRRGPALATTTTHFSLARRSFPLVSRPSEYPSSPQTTQRRNHFVAIIPSSMSDPPYRMGPSNRGTSSVAGVSTASVRNTTSSSSNEATSTSSPSRRGFDVTPIPTDLMNTKPIRTAACLVIGDEILNGKTMEKNSHHFAKYCFDLGIDLKRVEVIPDDEAEIIAASRRMVEQYDFVITTGGIGPTHDDITYASLAKAFNQNLRYHDETLRRMAEMNKHRNWHSSMNEQQREATRRMALFPENAEVIFIGRDIWVPVVRLEGKLCVFPGIPVLFQKMLGGLTNYLPLPPSSERPHRVQVFTERPESMIAPYLTALQERVKPCGISVGSYPVLGRGVFVCLIGKNPFSEIVNEVEREIGGKAVSEEEVEAKKDAARKMDSGADRPIEHGSVKAKI